MTERIRINKLKLDSTLAGKPVVHLHAPGAQYARFPVLYLFDPGLLVQVGIDPNGLEPGEDIHCNLWAHFELSEKMNARGNPYKDIISLERIDAPATTTSTDNSAILGELRAIKALLLELATGPVLTGPGQCNAPPTDDVNRARAERIHTLNRAGRTGTAADPQTTEPVEPAPELSEAEARTEFYTLAGPAIAEDRADPGKVNDLARSANGEGWNTALASLRELLDN